MKKIISLLFLLISITLTAQNENNSGVNQREFLKINSYPIESVAEYYSDIMDFLMISSAQGKIEKFGFINHDGTLFKLADFDYASDFKGKYANIIKDSVPGLLFKNGSTKYFPEYNITYWNEDPLGLAIRDNKYGFIDTNGKVIVALTYDDAFPFYQGYASVKKGEKWFYIDKKGKEVPFLKDLETSYKPIINDMALVSDIKKGKLKKGKLTTFTTGLTEFMTKVQGSHYSENLYHLQNKKILPFADYDEISGYFENGLMSVVKNGKIGFINRNNEIIIPIIYEQVKEISENKIIVKKDKLWGAIDLKNKIVIPFEYSYLNPFHEGLALFSKDINTKKIGYINASNEIVIPQELEFCWYGNFNKGIAVAKRDEKFGYIDKNGKFIISNIFKEAYPFKDGIALVKLIDSEKYTFINQKGNNILKMDFKQLYPVKNGLARFIN